MTDFNIFYKSWLHPSKNPFADDFPEILSINNLMNSDSTADFVAIKIGDVNLSSKTAMNTLNIRNSRPIEAIYLVDKKLEAGEEYVFDLNIKDSALSALQLALKIDKNKAESFNIRAGNLPEFEKDNIEVNEKQGIIAAAWASNRTEKLSDENSVIKLGIKARQSVWLHELISLDEQNMENLAD